MVKRKVDERLVGEIMITQYKSPVLTGKCKELNLVKIVKEIYI